MGKKKRKFKNRSLQNDETITNKHKKNKEHIPTRSGIVNPNDTFIFFMYF